MEYTQLQFSSLSGPICSSHFLQTVSSPNLYSKLSFDIFPLKMNKLIDDNPLKESGSAFASILYYH